MIKCLSVGETERVAAALAARLISAPRRRGALVVGLSGELGSGKTVFAQAFLRGFGVKGRITSPTFILIRKHRLRIGKFAAAYHVDLYRVAAPSEFFKLNLGEILKDDRNVVLVEWAEKIKRRLPKNAVWIYLRHGRKLNERLIKICYTV